MSESLRRFYAIVLADLRQRSRSTRFWVVLGLLAWASWACFPPLDAGYTTVSVGNGLRAAYSSAWIGMVLALIYAALLSLFGFYLVRGTLVRDFETRVWQLLVATPMTRGGFLLAKWASHMAVFGLIMAVGVVVGLAAQLYRAEVAEIALWEMLKPLLWIALPGMAVTAAMAVLFDLLPWLRRTLGNTVYFLCWIFLFSSAVTWLDPQDSAFAQQTWLSDPNGIALVLRDFGRVLGAAYPGMDVGGFSIGIRILDQQSVGFVWNHWQPGAADLAGRLLWIALSIGLLLALAPWLDWAASRVPAVSERSARPGRQLAWLNLLLRPLEGSALGTLLAAELKLQLRQRRLWWWLALLALAIVQLSGDRQAMALACLGSWMISLDLLARSVLREHEGNTHSLLFHAEGVATRLLRVRLLGAGLLTAVPVLPALCRLGLGGESLPLMALLAAAATVAAGGLALGALCRNPRPFELLMLLFGYLGLQGQSSLNFATDPVLTLTQHALLLPAALWLLWITWPRLQRIPG